MRNRLNTLVLVLPGQFLTVVTFYWMRFLPPLRPFEFHVPAPPAWALLAAVALVALPRFLPAAYFVPRSFERGGFYRALGLRWFRAIAPDGDWINSRLRRLDPSYRVVRDQRTRAEHIAGSIVNERWHTAWLLLGIITAGSAAATRQYGWALTVTALNVVFNLYPVLHQRYKRARLRTPVPVGSP